MTYKEILSSNEFSLKTLRTAINALSYQLIEEKKANATKFVFQSHEEEFKSLIEPFLGKPFFEKIKISDISMFGDSAEIHANLNLMERNCYAMPKIEGFPKEFITKNKITKDSIVELMIAINRIEILIWSDYDPPLHGVSIHLKNANSEILNVSVTQPEKVSIDTKKEGWIQKVIKRLFD